MPPPAVRAKWRPRLGTIVLAVLLVVMALPALVVMWFRAMDRTVNLLGPTELIALAVALVVTLVIAYVFTRTITAPVDALIRRTREIATGGRAAIKPLPLYGTAEIATLAQDLLDLATRLVDRSDYVASFASHVSHELKSPLTAIRGAAELLRDDAAQSTMSPAERQLFLDHIVADVDRLGVLLARLRDLAAAEQAAGAGRCAMRAVAAALAARDGLAVEASGDLDAEIAIPLEAAAIAFGHLADNARQHGATRLSLSVARLDALVHIVVADNGEGISHGNRALIFEPFFSTRRDLGGTGMGLSIARAMLQSHGGAIALLDSPAGASFAVTLKRAAG
jgi:two-component system OmpR family sensor kinase